MARAERLRGAAGTQADRWRTKWRKLVGGVACPRCHATDGRCVSLMNGTRATVVPHAERIKKARDAAQG